MSRQKPRPTTRSAAPPGLRGDAQQTAEPGGLETYLARMAPEVVAFTVGFDPAPEPARQSVTVRFTGRRLDLDTKPGRGDQFVHDETIDDVLADGGPVALTAKVPGVNPGRWAVTAHALPTPGAARRAAGGRVSPRRPAPPRVYPAEWSWRRWKLTEGAGRPVTTCLAPFAPAPAAPVGVWLALSVLGIVTALVVQRLIISADDLKFPYALGVSVAAILAGVAGAKLWYVVLRRRERKWDGWCIQGLVLGIAIVAPALLAAVGGPIGTFFDASAPGLLYGMGIGRMGCFFAGCCCGRPTASRWGVWSSDRRPLGMRRVPTQLMESGFVLAVGVAATAAVVRDGPANGAWFVTALAAYTVGRQGILQLRDERKSGRGAFATAIVGLVVLVVALIVALRAAP